MSPERQLTIARIMLTLLAVGTIVSPYLADWNATHIYNPLWPPHAKFHNAQTMVLGAMLGLAALFFTWRSFADQRTGLGTAWLFGGLYWLSQPFAFLFPGVAWTDPDLLPPGHSLHEFPLQLKGDLGVYALLAAVAWLILRNTRRAAAI